MQMAKSDFINSWLEALEELTVGCHGCSNIYAYSDATRYFHMAKRQRTADTHAFLHCSFADITETAETARTYRRSR
jgi:hypothetical protein